MIDLVAIVSRLAHICSEGGGRNGCLPTVVAVCAVVAAISVLIGTIIGRSPAYADGGVSSRSQASIPAPGDSDAMIRGYALQILRALSDRDANNWVRYWQARYACDAATAHEAPPRTRVLLTLTASICAQLDALFNVNPADYSPRGKDRSVGLLINESGAALGYTLFTGEWNHEVFLLDPLGRVAHAWHMNFQVNHTKLLDNGNLLAIAQDAVIEIDVRGNIPWRYSVGGKGIPHHDFLKMPNGNVLLIVEGRKTRDEAIAAGANPEFVHRDGIAYDYLLEVRPTGAGGGEVVWEWSAWDHIVQDFDPSKPSYGVIDEHPELIDINFLLESISDLNPTDWLHTNAIDYNPVLDQIMLSPRQYSELWIIDHSAATAQARGHSGGNSGIGGDLLYRWGNPRAYGQGEVADQRMFWQHQAHWIVPGLPGAGNILVFNNGNEFHGYRRYYSSIDELVSPVDGYRYRRNEDEAYPPDEPVWTYVAETRSDFYAPARSGTQRLPNGNTLIVDGQAGTISQATPDGRIVWKYVAPLDGRTHLRQGELPSVKKTFPTPYGDPVPNLTNAVYRAYWYPPDHTALQALDLTPGAYLEDIPDIYDKAYTAALAGDFGERLVSSDFDIYLDEDNRRLIYVKHPCADEDAQAAFFLHIIPANARDIPADRQEHGFDNLDFNYGGDEVKASRGRCSAARELPGYPIERIRTGQFTGAGQVWRTEIELGE